MAIIPLEPELGRVPPFCPAPDLRLIARLVPDLRRFPDLRFIDRRFFTTDRRLVLDLRFIDRRFFTHNI